jgi:hypothetical protein
LVGGAAHGVGTRNDTVGGAGRDGVVRGNVLDNDRGATAVLRSSALDNPAAGALAVQANGASYLDMGALVTQADPSGSFFGHDKIEGVAATDGGKTIYLANDSDFGLDHTNEAAGPYTLHQKTLPSGAVDDGEVLAVDVSKLPLVLGTATVTIKY